MTQVGWKAKCTEGGRKSLFLGSLGPGGGASPRTADLRGLGPVYQRLLRHAIYRWQTGHDSHVWP